METADMELLRGVFGCIDNTTLNATDSEASVEAFCRRSIDMCAAGAGRVAAVCVYPRFVPVAARILGGSGVRVASVAGAFPHGQLPIGLKVAEVKYAVSEGADEVDVVVSRGLLLSGEFARAEDEVAAMREACAGKVLKVIMETGELPSPTLVQRAAEVAIAAGADFIKTSTGKISVGATLPAAEVMLRAVAAHRDRTGIAVGFKAAGGIRTPGEALQYARLAQSIMGDGYVDSRTFRIGASSLTEKVFSVL